jgi:hypothetical protein
MALEVGVEGRVLVCAYIDESGDIAVAVYLVLPIDFKLK